MSLGGQTVTVINMGEATGYKGTGQPIYGDPVLTVVRGCSLQQLHASRDIDITDVSVSHARLFAPTTSPLGPTSVVADGVIAQWPLAADDDTPCYLVNGDPATWCDLNGRPHHIECYLRHQSG